MPTDQDVSVVLCAYTEGRWAELMAAIASVRRQTRQPVETLLVIDHNPAMLKRARELVPDIRVLANAGKRGAGGARNTGVRAAIAPLIAFLDDDAVAAPDWLEQIVRCHRDPRVLGAGGTITPAWQASRPPWFPPEFDWVVGCTHPGLPTSTLAVRNLIAANMSVRRQAFLALGGFREGFGKAGSRSGTEETDLCIRATQRWPEQIWLHHPPIRVKHSVPESRASFRYFLGRCHDEGVAKAAIVEFSGHKRGLASETSYVRVVLPRGIVVHVRDSVAQGKPDGVQRAGVIVVGLGATVAGYLRGTARRLLRQRRRGPEPCESPM